MFHIFLVFLVVSLNLGARTWAAVYSLPENGDTVIGDVVYRTVSENETLLDLARQFNLGINEIVAANPGVNPWLPGENQRVVIPTLFVLPPKPWEGIVVNLPEMRLYYFPPVSTFSGRRVMTMPLSIGKINWQTPVGNFFVKEKIKHPSWTVPQSIVSEHGLEKYGNRRIVPPGDEDNPLGNHAILLNETGYLIHGTNKPFSIGLRVSHGCIRLYPEDIDRLFDYIERGVPVRIINEPNKVGKRGKKLYLETHPLLSEDQEKNGINITPVINAIVTYMPAEPVPDGVWHQVNSIIARATGLPTVLTGFPGGPMSNRESTLKFSRY